MSGRRPAGPDFDLNPVSASEVRLGRWLDVTGTVRLPGRDSSRWRCPSHQRCATWWIDATDLQLHREQPPHSGSAGAAIMLKRPIVVFHDPVAEETDVRRDTRVRLQFSRQMAAETFGGRVRVAYDPPGRPAAAIPAFTAVYHEHTRGLEIRFGRPLEPHCTVKLELLEGIRALDGRVLLPWTMTFTTGNGT